MGTGFLYLLLGWAIMAAVAITLLIALYWIVRKAVSGGIRDARVEEVRRQS
ncbi:DUF6019 family protein [Brachybacterium tyrofermentans]|uniref:DUF6019 family protein n=1 Tax=Brachybacterium tyrofermentans TaxID=47848 RepID=UPI003FD54DE8